MSDKMIMLKTSDGESFTTEEIVAVQSQTLKCLIDDDCADTEIPIPNVTGKIMALVIEYCKKHVVVDGESSSSSDDEALKKWDAEFIKDKDQGTIFDLIVAANYLSVKSLLGFIHGVKPFEAFNFVSASFLSSLSLLLKSSVVNRERTDLPRSLRYINLVVMFKLVD